KREDGYMCYLSDPKALASFLCGLLTVYRTLLLMLIDINFYLIHSIIIFENTSLVLAHGYALDTVVKLFSLFIYNALMFYQWTTKRSV
ncbi:TPA: hypothetical protein ACG36G_004581, partial [Escherichia coli]